MIRGMLTEFDESWRARFDEKMALADQPILSGALTELVKARNSFCAWRAAELPIDKTIECFDHGCTVLRILTRLFMRTLEGGA